MCAKKYQYDTLHMGRCCIDLYSNEIGAKFEDIKTFSAYVGGSPTNICVGVCRLGLRTAVLTGVGQDPVGAFVLNFLVIPPTSAFLCLENLKIEHYYLNSPAKLCY